MARNGLKRVVKTVRSSGKSVHRTYWVSTTPLKGHKKVGKFRARVADAAAWMAGTATNQAASYAGRQVGRTVGGLVGLKLSPFLTPLAIPVGMRVGGYVGSTAASLLARPFTAFAANRVETAVAGGRIRRRGSFWLRGMDS